MAERGWREGERDDLPGGAQGDPGGDAILGAALEGLRRAAEEVEVERSTAETLQRSLLRERLPDVPGLRLAARYLPGSGEARIGGDWYDAIPLRDGRVALVIGDVVGRGIEAAARMAHLQSAVRAYALEGLRPSLILERMNGFVHELESRGTATLLLALVDPDAETVRLASAGHPPPLIVDADGNSTFAEGPAGNQGGA
jgi:serine phosphatase RsbU (regulator of sigma subunit)